jgi:hypothetical protein
MAMAAPGDTAADSRKKAQALGQRPKQMQHAAQHRLAAVEQGVSSYVIVKEPPRNPRKDLTEASRCWLHKKCPMRSADKRDVKYIPVGDGEAMAHQRRYRPWSMKDLLVEFNKTTRAPLEQTKFNEAECGCISSDKRRVCVCDYYDGTERDLKTAHNNRRTWHDSAKKTKRRTAVPVGRERAARAIETRLSGAVFAAGQTTRRPRCAPPITIAGHTEYKLECAERRCVQCKGNAQELLHACEIENSTDDFSWSRGQSTRTSSGLLGSRRYSFQ